MTDGSKRPPGRPPGSKNKSTLERERLERERMMQEAKQEITEEIMQKVEKMIDRKIVKDRSIILKGHSGSFRVLKRKGEYVMLESEQYGDKAYNIILKGDRIVADRVDGFNDARARKIFGECHIRKAVPASAVIDRLRRLCDDIDSICDDFAEIDGEGIDRPYRELSAMIDTVEGIIEDLENAQSSGMVKSKRARKSNRKARTAKNIPPFEYTVHLFDDCIRIDDEKSGKTHDIHSSIDDVDFWVAIERYDDENGTDLYNELKTGPNGNFFVHDWTDPHKGDYEDLSKTSKPRTKKSEGPYYVLVRENDNVWKVFDSFDKAKAEADYDWDRMTPSDKKNCEIFQISRCDTLVDGQPPEDWDFDNENLVINYVGDYREGLIKAGKRKVRKSEVEEIVEAKSNLDIDITDMIRDKIESERADIDLDEDPIPENDADTGIDYDPDEPIPTPDTPTVFEVPEGPKELPIDPRLLEESEADEIEKMIEARKRNLPRTQPFSNNYRTVSMGRGKTRPVPDSGRP